MTTNRTHPVRTAQALKHLKVSFPLLYSVFDNKSQRCMLNTVDGPSEAVENYLCDPEQMPPGTRQSRLPCPDDCVLGDWGPWSHCSLVRF